MLTEEFGFGTPGEVKIIRILCQKCGIRPARTILSSCDGRKCYEFHPCLRGRNGVEVFPTPYEQQKVVALAMESARQRGLDEESVSDAPGINVEEIRRILRGEGVSDLAVWQVIKSHLRMD